MDTRLHLAAAESCAGLAGLEAAPALLWVPAEPLRWSSWDGSARCKPLPPEAQGAGEVAPGALSEMAAWLAARVRPLAELCFPCGAPDFTLVPHKSRAVAFPPTFRD